MQIRCIALLVIALLGGCASDHRRLASTPDTGPHPLPTAPSKVKPIPERPTFYSSFRPEVTITYDPLLDPDWVYLSSNGVPDHCSPYFCAKNDQNPDCTTSAPGTWCASTRPGFNQEPNLIHEQRFHFKVPAFPSLRVAYFAATETGTSAIGIAVNGVALYDIHDCCGNDAGETELDTFDQYNGHPSAVDGGTYHYHIEPLWITSPLVNPAYGDPADLVGVMLDGIPLYGPKESDGTDPEFEPSPGRGDRAFHGHLGYTPDSPTEKIWHYHVTATSPYFVGRYKGKIIGTFSNP